MSRERGRGPAACASRPSWSWALPFAAVVAVVRGPLEPLEPVALVQLQPQRVAVAASSSSSSAAAWTSASRAFHSPSPGSSAPLPPALAPAAAAAAPPCPPPTSCGTTTASSPSTSSFPLPRKKKEACPPKPPRLPPPPSESESESRRARAKREALPAQTSANERPARRSAADAQSSLIAGALTPRGEGWLHAWRVRASTRLRASRAFGEVRCLNRGRALRRSTVNAGGERALRVEVSSWQRSGVNAGSGDAEAPSLDEKQQQQQQQQRRGR